MVGVTDPLTARPLVQIAGWLRGADGQAPTVVLASVIAPPGHEQVRANIGEFAADQCQGCRQPICGGRRTRSAECSLGGRDQNRD